jgi:hypothetical protein
MKQVKMETGIKHIVWLAFTLLIIGGFPSASVQIAGDNKLATEHSTRTAPVKPGASFNNSIVVEPLTAVFYQPDSLQLVELQHVMDAKLFKAMMHDYYYQFKYARTFLQKEWKQIEIVTVDKGRFLEFQFRNNTTEVIDLDKYEPCGLFLFDGVQKPVLADMTNLETFAGFYFSENNKQ